MYNISERSAMQSLFRQGAWALSRWRAASLLIALLLLWEVAARLIPQRATIVPAPSQILGVVFKNYSVFIVAIQPTILEATAGFLIGCTVALALALVFLRWQAAEQALYNLAVTLNSVPYLAIIPLLVIWLGNGFAPKIAIAAMATFFPVLVNATRGLKASDPQSLDMMHVLGASWIQTLVKLRLPMSLPYLFAAFKISAPAAVLGATVGEWIGSKTGIGYLILTSMFNFDVLMLWATMLVSALVALSGFLLFAVLERVTVGRWSEPVGDEDGSA
ncbi:MAG: ABC transporter permease [Chloroflexi bacterium]|nr:ABC transporter permease [Chloroflexota bacterium]